MSIILDIIKKPQILHPKKHILLLSHMRAYTSLFGHILGSHPEIEGYYEMHIGYYSWKSLIRQKQLYYKEHTAKNDALFIFDKVLHNEHKVSARLLTQKNVIPLFSLRPPAETIPSIMSLYHKVKPEHDFNKVQFATQYYIDRLKYLSNLASLIPNNFFYIDSQTLIENSVTSLSKLTKILNLNTPLTPEYESMNKTGIGNSGDHSSELKTGKIQHIKNKNKNIVFPKNLLNEAQRTYLLCRKILTTNAISSIRN